MATSHDVARLAGVSQPTVSRALRGVPGISAETVQRVRAAADALGYVPSETGRALSTQRTRRIGVVAGELTNPFYPELIEPMRSELDRRGYRMLLILDTEESAVGVERLSDGSLDGVMLTTSSVTSPIPGYLQQRKIPYVQVNRVVDGAAGDSCTFDYGTGAASVALYMIQAGHRLIGQISGPEHLSTGRDRDRAFRDTLAEHGIRAPREYHLRGPFTFDSGYRSAQQLLALPEPPTAIFCGNDVIALGAYNALLQHNASAPEPISMEIFGYDDISIASWSAFQLNTVRCDLARMARESVRLVVERIENPDKPFEHVVLPTELVIRRDRPF